MIDTVPRTLHVLSLNFTEILLGRLVSILKIRTLRQSYVKWFALVINVYFMFGR